MRPVVFRWGQLKVEGSSRAGDYTWFRVHPPGLAFDVGRGSGPLVGAERIFLTHGHLDHALGLPFVLSQRSMQQLGKTRLYCPAEIADRLQQFVAAASRLEEREYDYEILPLRAGDSVQVGTDLKVEAFDTEHPVPSLGYHLVRRIRHLRSEYRDRRPPELVRLKEQGVEISRAEEETWLSYPGDTGPGIFDREPRLFRSKVLLLECTFLGPRRREKAHAYGHLHVDDLAERAESFGNQVLLLHHLSRRHTVGEFRALIDQVLPDLASRIRLMVEPEEGERAVNSSDRKRR